MEDTEEENAITYETFRKFQKKEKNNEKLQDLPTDFFKSCMEWINRKEQEFEDKKDSTLLHELDNVKNIVRDIFNRRRKKILLLALHSVRSKKVSKNLLPEEEEFFETIVKELKELENDLLEKVLEGEEPETEGSEVEETIEEDIEDGREKISKEEDKEEDKDQDSEGSESTTDEKEVVEESVQVDSLGDDEDEEVEGEEAAEMDVEEGMELVKILEHVEEFVGTDEHFYGPLEEGDLVTLPEKIADFLVEEGKAEKSGV